MSGYNDPEKLRAAIELAQSFAKTKGSQKNKRTGGGDFAPPPEHRWEPHQVGQHSRYGQITSPSRQTFSSPGSSVPPPSQRSYGPSVNFSTGNVGRSPAIGTQGLDFIRRPTTVESPDSEHTQANLIRVPNQTHDFDFQTENGGNGETPEPGPILALPRPSGNDQCGNILDAFYSILAKKPSLGQEIETITKILPKAMDLNATGNAALDVPPENDVTHSHIHQCTCQEVNEKGKHERTCPFCRVQKGGVEKPDKKHSKYEVKADDTNKADNAPESLGVEKKPHNDSQGQIAGTIGEHRGSTSKPTKGLSASMWA